MLPEPISLLGKEDAMDQMGKGMAVNHTQETDKNHNTVQVSMPKERPLSLDLWKLPI